MHHSYIIPGVVDAAVMRDKAAKRLIGDNHNKPEETIVHYHRHGEHCDARCEHFHFPSKEARSVPTVQE
jgi:hypothetical protein